jgi:hypothetical protein
MDMRIKCEVCKRDIAIDWCEMVGGPLVRYTVYVRGCCCGSDRTRTPKDGLVQCCGEHI